MLSTFYSFFFFKQKTANEMRISDWSSDVCSSDLIGCRKEVRLPRPFRCQILQQDAAFGIDASRLKHRFHHLPRDPHDDARIVGRRGQPRRSGCRRRVRAITRAMCEGDQPARRQSRSEEHTSELQSLMRISYAVFCLKKKNTT